MYCDVCLYLCMCILYIYMFIFPNSCRGIESKREEIWFRGSSIWIRQMGWVLLQKDDTTSRIHVLPPWPRPKHRILQSVYWHHQTTGIHRIQILDNHLGVHLCISSPPVKLEVKQVDVIAHANSTQNHLGSHWHHTKVVVSEHGWRNSSPKKNGHWSGLSLDNPYIVFRQLQKPNKRKVKNKQGTLPKKTSNELTTRKIRQLPQKGDESCALPSIGMFMFSAAFAASFRGGSNDNHSQEAESLKCNN